MSNNSLLTKEWLEIFASCDELFLGLSGGIDSISLLHDLAQFPKLKSKLTAIHINHGLSPKSYLWARQVAEETKARGIRLILKEITINGRSNLEEEARNKRYDVFSRFILPKTALILAHHANDQAETLLLNLLRGSGIDGLSAMQSARDFAKGSILRPYLHVPKETIVSFAKENKLRWVEDESNLSTEFSRNFLRHEIFPRLTEKWPQAVMNMCRAASLCQSGSEIINAHIEEYVNIEFSNDEIELSILNSLTSPMLKHVLRLWLKKHKLKSPSEKVLSHIIADVIRARKGASPIIEVGKEVGIRRAANKLYLVRKDTERYEIVLWENFPEPLYINKHLTLTAKKASNGIKICENASIMIKFRQGGEQIRLNSQTKSVKKLFQLWQIPAWIRNKVPFVYVNNELAMIVGYAISDTFHDDSGRLYKISAINTA